jgi:hypothetical protein
MCEIDWTAAGTWALAILAFGSFWAQVCFSRRQLRESHESFEKSLEVQREVSRNDIATRLFLQMTDRFDSDRMHQMRNHLAYQILAREPDGAIKEDVMNFFEDLGALLLRGRLDEKLAYHAFCYHAIRWWPICKAYVERQRSRKEDPTLFSEFQAFAKRMTELDAAERRVHPTEIEPDQLELDAFLREEQSLVR